MPFSISRTTLNDNNNSINIVELLKLSDFEDVDSDTRLKDGTRPRISGSAIRRWVDMGGVFYIKPDGESVKVCSCEEYINVYDGTILRVGNRSTVVRVIEDCPYPNEDASQVDDPTPDPCVPAELTAGNIVRLRSGGPSMTINEIFDDNVVDCVWFSNVHDEMRLIRVKISVLELVCK